ncbi:unnamed protein product [Protopolystoma xenopodis]|uniref:Uncharacterized protein n=1 Tax=Protopolystoma xenopodis TaxID=117903 RepID=A0A448WR48_9PLAT|nr:unnamed protein product [Protopolystoma xenopodis]
MAVPNVRLSCRDTPVGCHGRGSGGTPAHLDSDGEFPVVAEAWPVLQVCLGLFRQLRRVLQPFSLCVCVCVCVRVDAALDLALLARLNGVKRSGCCYAHRRQLTGGGKAPGLPTSWADEIPESLQTEPRKPTDRHTKRE